MGNITTQIIDLDGGCSATSLLLKEPAPVLLFFNVGLDVWGARDLRNIIYGPPLILFDLSLSCITGLDKVLHLWFCLQLSAFLLSLQDLLSPVNNWQVGNASADSGERCNVHFSKECLDVVPALLHVRGNCHNH